jgi:hypothetical protein
MIHTTTWSTQTLDAGLTASLPLTSPILSRGISPTPTAPKSHLYDYCNILAVLTGAYVPSSPVKPYTVESCGLRPSRLPGDWSNSSIRALRSCQPLATIPQIGY